MSWKYTCGVCGCYLDPGEGRICDECQNKNTAQDKRADKFKKMLYEASGQIEMRLEELV